jgi:hypothetical protein
LEAAKYQQGWNSVALLAEQKQLSEVLEEGVHTNCF